MPDCENCNERCPQAEMAHEIALGRMYATNELVKLVKQIDNGQLVEVVRCIDCKWSKRDTMLDKHWCKHFFGEMEVRENDYCSYGEKKDDGK